MRLESLRHLFHEIRELDEDQHALVLGDAFSGERQRQVNTDDGSFALT